ncbi:hypothetical protein [Nocardia wallacei]|uniref:hypothetical protein n=1 Tax=Nocardia wallacei TaxID=480035 RepID=UPI002457865F|nr:hypothetical protein [Nocardia wallacei]
MRITSTQWCRVLPVAGGVVVASVLAGGCGSGQTVETGHPPTTTTQAATDPVAADGCVQSRTADVVSGSGPGGESDGPDAILAFEHAYYVDRSATAAMRVAADGATSGHTGRLLTAEDMQHGIDHIPADTRYCVRIAPAVTGDIPQGRWRYAVTLTQQPPGQPPAAMEQVITTARDEQGRARITAITPA